MSDVQFKPLPKKWLENKSSSSILLLIIITLLAVIRLVSNNGINVTSTGKTISEAQNQLVQSSGLCLRVIF